MRRRSFLVALFLFVMVLLVGSCGVPQNQYDLVAADLENTRQELFSVQAELVVSESKVSDLTSSLEEHKADLEAKEYELAAVQEELAEIKEVYPPRDFSTSKELQDWLAANDVSEFSHSTVAENLYAKALQIQEDALTDGLIISVDLDPGKQKDEWYISCVAVIDGELWAWGPESDEPTEVSSMIGFTKLK